MLSVILLRGTLVSFFLFRDTQTDIGWKPLVKLTLSYFFRWAFKMYDKDGSGTIELPEMIEIIGTLYEMEGVSKVRK